MKPKIILFVRQLSFARQYFDYLLSALSTKYDIYIFHTNNLESSNINENCPYINYDISNLSHKKVQSLLNKINPSDLLVTNIRSLLDIYIFITCNMNNIPLTYIEHGLTLNKISRFKASNKYHSLIKYLNYCKKVIGYLLSCRNPISNFRTIKRAIINSDYTGIKLNNALLYAPGSKGVLDKHFDLSKTIIRYSGYPIVNKNSDLQFLLKSITKKQAVYIHQPLIIDNFSELSISDEVELLQELNDIFKKNNYSLIIKLHPRDDIRNYKNKLPNCNIIGTEMDIHQLIASSEIVLGHFSTALLTAVLLKKSLYILDYWKIKNDANKFFSPIAPTISKSSEIELIFTDRNTNTRKMTDSFIKNIIGFDNSKEARIQKLEKLLC
ncbi:polysialyltransferase family glycosyltransferase [uncultured Draconibacterium sp.]|uniref:polysialyltransferase family glycosyltransferase n=1 Tax=uncultured Draconibacterium sp. TaxID=1573823 RepID=UPI0029C60055|nr:hypothetical protein [uncultured Draconibacterium sp.]